MKYMRHWVLTTGGLFLLLLSRLVDAGYPVTIGSEFVIANFEVREQSLSVAFDGTNYLVGIQGDDTLHNRISARFVSKTGALIGDRISFGGTGGAPCVAFDGTNYLLVWENDASVPKFRIYGQFISSSGSLVGSSFPISITSGRLGRSLTFDGSNYLVVWEDWRNDSNRNTQCDTGEGTCDDIYGQFVTPDGTLQGPEIPISTDVERQRVPAVAFDGTRYLVVWGSRQTGQPERWDVYGKFVTKGGGLTEALSISQTPSSSYNPISISFDATNYLVVWNKDIGPGFPDPTIWDIYGRMVSPSGAFPGAEFPISTAPGDQFIPSVGFDGQNYLITWTDIRNGTDMGIYGQVISPSASLVGSEFLIIDKDGNQGGSSLAFDGTKYLIVFNSGGINWDDSSNWDVHGAFVTMGERCAGDFDGDEDVDGLDLATAAQDPSGVSMSVMAKEFGRTDCPSPYSGKWAVTETTLSSTGECHEDVGGQNVHVAQIDIMKDGTVFYTILANDEAPEMIGKTFVGKYENNKINVSLDNLETNCGAGCTGAPCYEAQVNLDLTFLDIDNIAGTMELFSCCGDGGHTTWSVSGERSQPAIH